MPEAERKPGDMNVCQDCGELFEDPPLLGGSTDRCPKHYYQWSVRELDELREQIRESRSLHEEAVDRIAELDHRLRESEGAEMIEIEKYSEVVNEGDRLRLENNELTDQLSDLQDQLDELQAQLVIARRGKPPSASDGLFGDLPKEPGETWGPFYWLSDQGTENPQDVVVGNLNISGVPHHAIFLRILEEHGAQHSADPYWNAQLDDLVRLAGADEPMLTVQLPKRSGNYVVAIYPHED